MPPKGQGGKSKSSDAGAAANARQPAQTRSAKAGLQVSLPPFKHPIRSLLSPANHQQYSSAALLRPVLDM